VLSGARLYQCFIDVVYAIRSAGGYDFHLYNHKINLLLHIPVLL